MTQQLSPWLEGAYGWSFGEGGWNTGMDQNLLKFSFMFDRNVDAVVDSLPAAVNGKAYYLTTDNRLYFAVGTTWFSAPTPKWFDFVVRSTGAVYQFNGTAAVAVDSLTDLGTRLSATEVTLSSLGTAAFKDIEFFATQSALDVVSANSQNYTDVLRQDLASNTDLLKGAELIGWKSPLTGAVARTQSDINKGFVRLEDFGAVGDGVADDTAKVQTAFDSGHKRILATSGKTYNITSVTMSGNNTELVLESGATIAPQNPTARAITVSGHDCSITGKGTIKGLAVFDGLNAQPTYALVWVTGNNFSAFDITIDTIPKEGIMFSNSTGGRIEGCRIIGRYPYASYDENTTTNHCAILSDIPASATNPEPTLTVVGNYFESCIQGVLSANYGAAGNNTGNTITGNTFVHCWDHGVYMSRGVGHTIVGNTFLSCRRPIVSDGVGSTVVGNTLYSALTGVSNAEQLMSVRESSHSIIANNTIYGVDAAIFVDCIETTTMDGNIISGNNIYSTGTVHATALLRLGVGATQCEQNIIRGNTLQTSSLGAANYMLQVTMAGGFGRGNQVSDNTLVRGIPGNGIYINRNGYSATKNNRVDISGTSVGALSLNGIFIDNSTFPIVDGNNLYYTSGGTNVTATGINVTANCALPKVHDNSVYFTASLAGYTGINTPSGADVKRNAIDPNFLMVSTFTWPSTTASFVVANANVTVDSTVMVSPSSASAGVVMATKGFYVAPTLGGFTIFTGDATSTVDASTWRYEVV
jgi:parallel beta-helix repeat protein